MVHTNGYMENKKYIEGTKLPLLMRLSVKHQYVLYLSYQKGKINYCLIVHLWTVGILAIMEYRY